MSVESTFEVAPHRRFTLSVLVDEEPGVAARLAGLLRWRGHAFDRVVLTRDGDSAEVTRIIFTLTDTPEAAETLMGAIRRYGPVKALREFYTAPVVAPAGGGTGLHTGSIGPTRLCANL